VHSENHVKITDFGLAKLVSDSTKFHAEGEKVCKNMRDKFFNGSFTIDLLAANDGCGDDL
jgi:hypothetical protein